MDREGDKGKYLTRSPPPPPPLDKEIVAQRRNRAGSHLRFFSHPPGAPPEWAPPQRQKRSGRVTRTRMILTLIIHLFVIF